MVRRKPAGHIHLHGSLGHLSAVPWAATTIGESFDETLSSVFAKSAESIKIVHEPKPGAEEFTRARYLLTQAKRIFFLGFAFGRTNVDRLDFNYINKDAGIKFSRYGMTDSEAALYIQQPFNRAQVYPSRQLPPAEWDCLQLLKENITDLVERY